MCLKNGAMEKRLIVGLQYMKKKRLWKWTLILFLLIVVAFTVTYFVLRYSSYEYAQIIKTHDNKSASNGNYVKYADGILEYSRDGIAMLTKEGEEIWNQPCQMGNPMAHTCKNAAVVADKGGTNIYVFQRDGLKGEIQTTRPIERVTVSSQGIVAAILQNEAAPKIICYDAKGNILVELKASLTGTGYPIAIDLSQDGNVLIVSYLSAKGNGASTNVTFYHFGENKEGNKNYQVAQKDYSDTIIPMINFVGKEQSLLVSDHSLIFYEGLEQPEETQIVAVKKEIQSVAYDEEYIAMLLKNSKGTGHELLLYRMNGKKVMGVKVEGEYTDIKIEDGQVFLYDEKQCAIYNSSGVCKFEGALEMNILNIYPITGLNKYMVISANGFQEIQLAK